ncbi:uncharacterized protein si:dkey-29h14.10 [Anguilla rostrata]|uniref:uncharacterized protein si:dkey-29h14.10 n=1 Tax=Anguilla rostrata TaxID=7938 RepID=UPI0030CE38B4
MSHRETAVRNIFTFSKEKSLLRRKYALSTFMSSCLLERISDYLSSKRTIAMYESQMIRFQCTDLQQPSQFIQTVIRKGRRACQLFYKLLESCDPLLYESATGSPASDSVHQTPPPLQTTALIDRQDMAPTYIINIHDSTLNNCIFGSNNGQCINAERQYPPFYSPEHVRHEAEMCSCRCGQQGPAQSSSSAPQSLQVHSSDMEYVIIGDNNTMTVETEGLKEEEEGEEEEQALI